jgi:hypothetical protein
MMQRLIVMLLLKCVALPAVAAEMWVTADHLNRRTCPSTDCGIVGILMFREKIIVHEQSSGWARISDYYDAFCGNRRSRYVYAGNDACIETNGIVGGQFAEWVYTEHLSTTRPADPAAGATGAYALISGSEDYRLYKDIFAKKALTLISAGQCREVDFAHSGGWLKSLTTYHNSPVYFTYCGGMQAKNQIYLNVQTGDIFK